MQQLETSGTPCRSRDKQVSERKHTGKKMKNSLANQLQPFLLYLLKFSHSKVNTDVSNANFLTDIQNQNNSVDNGSTIHETDTQKKH